MTQARLSSKSWIGPVQGSSDLYFVTEGAACEEDFSPFMSVAYEGNHVLLLGRPEEGSSETTFTMTCTLPKGQSKGIGEGLDKARRIVIVVFGKPHWAAEYDRKGHLLKKASFTRLTLQLALIRFRLLTASCEESVEKFKEWLRGRLQGGSHVEGEHSR